MTERIGITLHQYGHGENPEFDLSIAIWVGAIRFLWPKWRRSGLWLYARDERGYFQPYQRVELRPGWRLKRIMKRAEELPVELAGGTE